MYMEKNSIQYYNPKKMQYINDEKILTKYNVRAKG